MKLPEFYLASKTPFADADAKDKPLGFYWKAPADWLADLDLPPPRNVRYGRARAAILLDAVLEAHGKGRAISYSRSKAFYTGLQRYDLILAHRITAGVGHERPVRRHDLLGILTLERRTRLAPE